MSSATTTAPTQHSPSATDKIEPYVWKIAGVVILGMIMSILDTTIVNVALRTLGHDLHSSISQIQWVVTGYLLSLAAVIPVTGWAARRYGPKRMGRVMAIISMPAMLGPILGPVVGGAILQNLHWSWIFLVNVPIGAVA